MGLTYDGQDLFVNWGISVDSSQTWEKPERDREFIHVPGRSGDLILDRGSWMNVEIEYACRIDSDFATKFEEFVAWLSSYKSYAQLYDEKHPDVYRMAVPVLDELSPKTLFTTETADFTLLFNCQPQQYVNDGVDHDLTLDFSTENADGEINPGGGYWQGSPLVTVFAPGGALFTIENETGIWRFEVAPFNADRLEIDFETGDAVLQDELGEYAGNGNPYLTVTPPNAYAPDFPSSTGFIYAYHSTAEPDDPEMGGGTGADDMNEGTETTETGTTYTGYLTLDPRFWRI